MQLRHVLRRVGVSLGGLLVVWSALALEFSTTFVPPVGEARHPFTLADDTEIKIYSTLGQGATCGNSGFSIVGADGVTDVVRSGFAACDPATRSGPWALKAGAYTLKLWHNGSGGSYQVRVATVSSSLAADAEPNNTPATALPLDAQGGRVSGHLGYGDTSPADSVDYYRFTLPSAGALAFTLSADATLPASGRGYTVYGSDGSSVVRDLSRLDAGTYHVAVYADTYYVQGYGGYTLQSSFTPEAPAVGSIQATNLGANARQVALELTITPGSVDRTAPALQLFVAGLYAGQWYFVVLDGSALRIVPYTGGEFPVFTTVAGVDLASRRFSLPLGDLSSVIGLDIYAGYGLSATDMLNRNQVVRVHQVR